MKVEGFFLVTSWEAECISPARRIPHRLRLLPPPLPPPEREEVEGEERRRFYIRGRHGCEYATGCRARYSRFDLLSIFGAPHRRL
jgi:hypothetical protein